MKVALDTQLVNADDTPALLPPAKEGAPREPATLKYFVIQAMLADNTGVQPNGVPIPIPQEQKIRRYELYKSFKKSKVGFVLLSAEDIAFIKEAVRIFSTLTVGQLHEMLETPYIEPPAHPTESVMMYEDLMRQPTMDEFGAAAP